MWSIFVGLVIVVACVLAAVFLVGTYNVAVEAWGEWRKRRGEDRAGMTLSDDPFWMAVASTLFAVLLYGLVVVAVLAVVL